MTTTSGESGGTGAINAGTVNAGVIVSGGGHTLVGTAIGNVGGTPSWWGGTPSSPAAAGGGLPSVWGTPSAAAGTGTGPVWGGRGPSATRLATGDRPGTAGPSGWIRADGPARGETGPARAGVGLGVRVDPGQVRPPVNVGRPAPGLSGSGQGGPDGRQGQGRRRSLRETVRDWFCGPLHESPDPIPAWLARLLLRWWPGEDGPQDEPASTGAGAGAAVAVPSGGGVR